MLPLPPDAMLHLSQGLLNVLATCPRKFQHLYIDQLSLPIAPDQQERLDWGNRFHLLMQQRELGLLPSADEVSDPEAQRLHQAIEAIVQAAPGLFEPNPTAPAIFRQSEHHRTLEIEGYLLTVIYDLLILNEAQAQILDWKTSARPENPRSLAQNWQTRLYPYVLAETSHYAPAQISMTYWFITAKPPEQSPEQPLQPQPLKFAYSEALHRQTTQDLTHLLRQLTGYLKQYQTHAAPFPQVTIASPACDRCAYAGRCQRGHQEHNRPESVATLKEIQEIELGTPGSRD